MAISDFCKLSMIMIISIVSAMFGELKTTQKSVEIPIALYHSVQTTHQEGNQYVISIEEMREDLQYLKDNNFTPIHMSQLIDFVYYGEELPHNPIILTFDDGYEDNYTYLLPLLKEFEMKAVVCLISSYFTSEPLSYELPFLNKEQVIEMFDTGLIEFQSHTYDMHFSNAREGSFRLKDETLEDYVLTFWQDIEKDRSIYKELSLPTPTTFSYPGGKINRENEVIIDRLGFVASFATWPVTKNIVIANKPVSLKNLTRYNRDAGFDTEIYFQELMSF